LPGLAVFRLGDTKVLNNLTLDQKDAFYEEHGAYVVLPEGPVLFETGAMDENSSTSMGRLIPPPADSYELATLQLRYAQIVCEQSESQFIAYKSYLSGNGRREDAWAKFYTEESRIKHLKYLRSQAMRARAKLAKAKRAVKDEQPAWMRERDEQDALDAARQQEFLDSVDSIEL
jgi:hypothetical protein